MLDIELELMLIFYVLFVAFLTGWESLLRLSPGRVRRIENEDRDLARRAEQWIAEQPYYDTIFRIICLALLGTVSIMLVDLLRNYSRFQHRDGLALGVSAAIVVAGIVFAEAVARLLLDRFYRIILKVFMPVSLLLRRTLFAPAVLLLRYVSAELEASPRHDPAVKTTAEDEIMSLVEKEDDAVGGNALEEDARKMIRGIFDLGDTPVREIMTPRVDMISISLTASVQEARKLFLDSAHSRIPVYKDTIDEVVGIIFAKDFLDEERCRVQTLEQFTHKAFYVPESKNVGDLLEELRRESNHLAVVIDEYGGTAGIVTLEDILEEIVGEIRDEYDTAEDDDVSPVELGDGSIVLDGRYLISDINERFDLDLPEDEDVDTIGGYVCGDLGRIPETGEEIVINEKFKVKIIKADRRKIISLKLQPLLPEN